MFRSACGTIWGKGGLWGVCWGLLLTGSTAWGQVETEGDNENPLAGVDIIKIEEDWLLDIADPDPAADCPQVVTVFGPGDPSYGTHAIFELNHGTLPDYGEGGMQLQVWFGQYLIGYKGQHSPAELHVAVERLTYTTVTAVWDHRMKLYVKNGDSVTWGDFGHTSTSSLKVELDTWRDHLNDWDSEGPIRHSRVSYGANRVNKYMRTAVRYYTADGLHHTDETPRYVHRLAEDAVAPAPVNE
jgi:hypothetical protein